MRYIYIISLNLLLFEKIVIIIQSIQRYGIIKHLYPFNDISSNKISLIICNSLGLSP